MTARSTTHDDTLLLAEAAMAVALSVALGSLRLLELPAGGSVSLGMLPLLAFAVVRGFRAGVLAGTCAGLAHALTGGTIVHPAQLLLDYGVAYAAAGIAAIGSARGPRATSVAVVLAGMAQYAAFVTSGVVFFAQQSATGALAFSMAYNAVTVVPETIIGCLLLPVVLRAHQRVHGGAPARAAPGHRRMDHPNNSVGVPQLPAALPAGLVSRHAGFPATSHAGTHHRLGARPAPLPGSAGPHRGGDGVPARR